MWYFDTNILIYSITAVDEAKMRYSQRLINDSLKNNKFSISPVTLQELIFVLTKLRVEKQVLRDSFRSFLKYSKYEITSLIIKDAFDLCDKLDFCKSVNDAIHLKYAEKYCQKLLTFDGDFKKFKPHSELDIEIIEVVPEPDIEPGQPNQSKEEKY
jgi:predicted nucleic acid-binding protein